LVNSNNEEWLNEPIKEEEEDLEEENEDEEQDEEDGEDNEEDAAKAMEMIQQLKSQLEKDKKNNRLQPHSYVASGAAPSKFFNKQRVLVFASRGVHSRNRHLIDNIRDLLPHAKKEPKYDSTAPLQNINEVAELRSCTGVMYFEQTKRDCFVWLSKTPNGPSAKFILSNVHTLEELKLVGNCLKGSRPILVFDKTFESDPKWLLIKELLFQTFGTPKLHPKSKPFIDHVYSFHIADDRVWFRHYQIAEDDPEKKSGSKNPTELVEIGPRFILNPVRIFAGSFGGPTLYQNSEYMAAIQADKDMRRKKSAQTQQKVASKKRAVDRKGDLTAHDPDFLDDVFE